MDTHTMTSAGHDSRLRKAVVPALSLALLWMAGACTLDFEGRVGDLPTATDDDDGDERDEGAGGTSHGGPSEPGTEGGDSSGTEGDEAPVEPDLPAVMPEPEACNGLDDDLDDKVDEGCVHTIATIEDYGDLISGDGLLAFREQGDAVVVSLATKEEIARWPLTHGGSFMALQQGRLAVLSDDREQLWVVNLDDGAEAEVPIAFAADDRHGPPQDVQFWGDRLIYSLSLPTTGVWQDENELYMYDFGSGEAESFASHTLTIQTRVRVADGMLAWDDDRDGHHPPFDTIGHYFDIAYASVDAPNDFSMLTMRSETTTYRLDAFDGRQLLVRETDRGVQAAGAGALLLLTPNAEGVERRDVSHFIDPAEATQLALQDGLAVFYRPLFTPEPDRTLISSELFVADLEAEDTARMTASGVWSSAPIFSGDHVVWSQVIDREAPQRRTVHSMDLSDYRAGDFFPPE